MRNLKDIVSEACYNDIMNRVKAILEGSCVDQNGYTQFTFDFNVPNEMEGRNFKKENEEAQAKLKAEREAHKNRVKNPKRVAGGKQAHATRIANKTRESYSRPLIQKLEKTRTEEDK